MQLQITGKNLDTAEWMKTYVEKKLGRLDRYLDTIDDMRVELSYEPTKNADHRQVVQVTLRTGGRILRAEERASDMRDAIDAVVDKVYRQIVRFKGRNWFRVRAGLPPAQAEEELLRIEELVAEAEEEEEGEEPAIVRRKRFQVNPMDEGEAIEQMELLGHDFFLFYNVDSATINLVYRRRDGNYGLLQPELA